MILLGSQRSARHDYWLGGTTAVVAGLVNVCSVVAFFAFASNVTGHVAVLTEELVKGHWHQLRVVAAWLACFLGGAFLAHLLATTAVGRRSPEVARATALGLEMAALSAVGYYGQVHYGETLSETELLVGLLLTAMGLQNGLVATVSRGVVKTTHLTGLMTDLGIELSMLVQRRAQHDRELRFKLNLHVLILLGYIGGGIAGGMLFVRFGFVAFHVGTLLLGGILAHDWMAARAGATSRASVRAIGGPATVSAESDSVRRSA